MINNFSVRLVMLLLYSIINYISLLLVIFDIGFIGLLLNVCKNRGKIINGTGSTISNRVFENMNYAIDYRFGCRTLLIIVEAHINLREKPRNMMSKPFVNKRLLAI